MKKKRVNISFVPKNMTKSYKDWQMECTVDKGVEDATKVERILCNDVNPLLTLKMCQRIN